METAAGLIKLKPDTTGDLQEWCDTLNARREDVLASLRNEGVTIESWFQIEIAGQPYLLWFMQAESIARAREVFLASDQAIDAYHLEKMTKMSESQIEATSLLNLSIDSD